MIPKLSSKSIKQDKNDNLLTMDEKINSIQINMRFRMATLTSYFFCPQYYLSLV